MKVTDWPKHHIRGVKAECRYGTNVMEREDWLAILKMYDLTQIGQYKAIASIARPPGAGPAGAELDLLHANTVMSDTFWWLH